ncbi:MAG: RNA polymerase sigma factor [Clostridia bacterium]|nr:RNA polymerase sigma factor [Clostridia bacterium]
MEDNKIVELYLQRDETAISLTAEKYGSKLRNLAFGIVNDVQTAEECENDTYMEAWKSIPPHEPKSYLYAFLARITRHISLNFCRNRNSLKRSALICELTAEMEQCIPSPNDVECRIDDMVFSQLLNDFLSSLAEEKRNVFIRRYWYLDSIAAISKRFSLSESKVKTMLFRCRKQLLEHIEKENYEL